MHHTAAALAPAEIPMMSGLASGLRSMVWKAAPAAPKASPASRPARARGSRSVPIAKEAPLTCSPDSTRSTSESG